MSSVIISGDTSGAVTVTVPAVAGTNTVTIPASTGTVMVSGNMPAFSAYANASQSVTTGVATKVAINTELFDTNSNFDSTTNYRFTPTVEGYYQVNGAVRLSATVNTPTQAVAYLYKNGSVYSRGSDTVFSASTLSTVVVAFNEVVYLNGSTDYIELYGSLTATSPNFNFASSAITSRFSAAMVRGA
jgi:hypothetical protein